MGTFSFTWALSKAYKSKILKMEEVLKEKKDITDTCFKHSKCCKIIKIIKNKVDPYSQQYGKGIMEMIDFSKDIYYCYIVSHVSQNLTILLWMFALYAFTYQFLYTMTMTKR